MSYPKFFLLNTFIFQDCALGVSLSGTHSSNIFEILGFIYADLIFPPRPRLRMWSLRNLLPSLRIEPMWCGLSANWTKTHLFQDFKIWISMERSGLFNWTWASRTALIEDNIWVFIGGERIGFMASFHLIEAYSSVVWAELYPPRALDY